MSRFRCTNPQPGYLGMCIQAWLPRLPSSSASNHIEYQYLQIYRSPHKPVRGPHASLVRGLVMKHLDKQGPGQSVYQAPLACARPPRLRHLQTAWNNTSPWPRQLHVCFGLWIVRIKTSAPEAFCKLNVAETISDEACSETMAIDFFQMD